MRFFHRLALSAGAWGLLLLLAVGMEAVALYYQHILGEPPCVLCIQVRLIVLGLAAVALVELFARPLRTLRLAGELAGLVLAALLGWKAWQLLAVERGWTVGECGMALGLPDWLAVDRWLPWLFRPEVPCGYTPVLPGGFTMAEVLPALSGLLIFGFGAMLLADLAE